MQTLDSKSPIPLYQQLENILRDKIDNKFWKENDMIPSENALSKDFGLSRMTVRSVLQKLAQDGLLYRVPGKGTFVSKPKLVSRPLSQAGIREQLDKMGYKSVTKLLRSLQLPATAKVARQLAVPEGTQIYDIQRMRLVDNKPFSIHSSYIPQSQCRDLLSRNFDFEKEQLCDILLNGYGIEQKSMKETLEVVLARNDEAELLKVKKSYPLIHLENIIYAVDGSIIEYSSVLFRGDQIKIEICNTYNN